MELGGFLDSRNAPGLPWVDLIEQVELRAVRRGGTEVIVHTLDPECECWWTHEPGCQPVGVPVTAEQVSAMEQAIGRAHV